MSVSRAQMAAARNARAGDTSRAAPAAAGQRGDLGSPHAQANGYRMVPASIPSADTTSVFPQPQSPGRIPAGQRDVDLASRLPDPNTTQGGTAQDAANAVTRRTVRQPEQRSQHANASAPGAGRRLANAQSASRRPAHAARSDPRGALASSQARAQAQRGDRPTRQNRPRKGLIAALICLFVLFCAAAGIGIAYAVGAIDLSFLRFSPEVTGEAEPPAQTSEQSAPASEGSQAQAAALPTVGDVTASSGSDAPANEPSAKPAVVGSPASVSLSAVGDNLMHIAVINTADAAAGTMGDGEYNFTVLYEGVRDIVDTHDINFIDIETIMGGDELGPSGYPSFNTPSQDAAAIAEFGFNLATTATNHSWDQGLEGIKRSSAYWAEHPEVVVTGSFVSEEDRGTIRTFEKNGVTFAFLAYQDFLNGYVLPDDQKWAIADSNDREAVKKDIEKAHELAECVIVAMSWGDEYAFEPNSSQTELAQFFADNGVDLVLGFGPHVIQPVQWLQGKDSSGNATDHQTLVVYSLGNFVSNQHNDFNMVEGCFTCNIVRDEAGAISLVDLTWIPLVCHISGYTNHSVYQLKNYSADLAATNEVLGSKADPIGYVKDLTTQIIDPQVVTIDM